MLRSKYNTPKRGGVGIWENQRRLLCPVCRTLVEFEAVVKRVAKDLNGSTGWFLRAPDGITVDKVKVKTIGIQKAGYCLCKQK